MSQNSVAMVASYRDLVDRDCVLLDGDCQCYLPKEDCKYLKTEVFFGKKGGRITKEEKLSLLKKQMKSYNRRVDKIAAKLMRIQKLVEEAEGTE